MEREAWEAIVHRVAKVRHDLVTKPPPPQIVISEYVHFRAKN